MHLIMTYIWTVELIPTFYLYIKHTKEYPKTTILCSFSPRIIPGSKFVLSYIQIFKISACRYIAGKKAIWFNFHRRTLTICIQFLPPCAILYISVHMSPFAIYMKCWDLGHLTFGKKKVIFVIYAKAVKTPWING